MTDFSNNNTELNPYEKFDILTGFLDYKLLTELSGMTYESNQCKAMLAIDSSNNDIDYIIRFDCDKKILFDYDHIKEIRKLLEISNDNLILSIAKNIGDNSYILNGYGKLNNNKVCLIKFLGYSKWNLNIVNNVILKNNNKDSIIIKYEKGELHPYLIKNNIFYLQENIKDFFELDCDKSRKIISVIEQASKQTHGTSIIITDDNCEPKRLVSFNRAIKINKIDFYELANKNDELKLVLDNITIIDGAIIINSNGICECIGAILDGRTVLKGSTGRGARYNVLTNYIKWKHEDNNTHKYMSIIISEDGDFTWCYMKDGNLKIESPPK